MYCVIQEIQTKKANPFGESKELEAYQMEWSINGEEYKKWDYRYTGGRFERPIKKAYKISIHKSYREGGKVKKKQWALCTIGYYNVLDSSPYDYINGNYVQDIIKELDITEEEFWNMVYKKYDPLRERIEYEFQQTEEYTAKQEHERIKTIYFATKVEFEEKYGKDTYDYCYDIFGVLRNEEYLNKVKADYEAQQKYYSSYHERYQSNYNDYGFSGYFQKSSSNYNDTEKEYLKIIYKAAAMKLHPDIKKDNGEGMKFLNKLKDEWGI